MKEDDEISMNKMKMRNYKADEDEGGEMYIDIWSIDNISKLDMSGISFCGCSEKYFYNYFIVYSKLENFIMYMRDQSNIINTTINKNDVMRIESIESSETYIISLINIFKDIFK